MKTKILSFSKDLSEYETLFPSDTALTVFVRKNIETNPDAVDAFIEIQKAKGFSDKQCKYVRELLTFISQNGSFQRSDLLREELNFGSLFDNITIQSLLADIEARV